MSQIWSKSQISGTWLFTPFILSEHFPNESFISKDGNFSAFLPQTFK